MLLSNEPLHKYLNTAQKQYDYVCISLQSELSYYSFTNTVEILRARLPGSTIITGGHYASLCWKKVVKDCDYVCLGDGISVYKQLLVDKLNIDDIAGIAFFDGNSLHYTPPRESMLKSVNPYEYSVACFDPWIEKEPIQLIASYGCEYSCSFCSVSAYRKKIGRCQYIRYTPKELAQIIEFVHKHLGASCINFMDDHFYGGDFKSIQELSATLNANGIIWSAELRADTLIKCLSILKESTVGYIRFGIESYHSKVLARYRKSYPVEKVVECVHELFNVGIYNQSYFILFDCFSTYEELMANLRFMKLCYSCTYNNLISKLIAYENTEYYNMLEKQGLIDVSQNTKYSFLNPEIEKVYASMIRVLAPLQIVDQIIERVVMLIHSTHLCRVPKWLVLHRKKASDCGYYYAAQIINSMAAGSLIDEDLLRNDLTEKVHDLCYHISAELMIFRGDDKDEGKT